ncbi:MAG: beta-xylosidase [Chloroflexi bacterium]|nr:beta-xylosidase [Chloroflexota bacterium]
MTAQSNAHNATVTVRLDGSRTPLRRIWRSVGYDEPNYTYTPSGRELLGKLGGMSDAPYFIRCHFILCSGDGTGRLKWGSTNVYSEDADGNPVYSWTLIDRILDATIETGCIPFVELGFMPEALSTAPAGTPYDDPRHGGWRFPPKDYGRWLELIRHLASHCLERYGLAAVSRWYWELWNEPDIFYWTGSSAEFCRLYDYTEAGLHAVLPQALLGGPATTSSALRPQSNQFLRDFLEHITHGVNSLTGQRGTRLDFISYHSKGGGYGVEPNAAKKTPTMRTLLSNVAAGLAVINDFPALAGREVILSECDPDGWAAGSIHDNPNLAYRNSEYYASYVACTANKLIDLRAEGGARIDGMLTWAFQFENREYFEGHRSLSTNGIDKPVLNVFRLLAKLGSVRLPLESNDHEGAKGREETRRGAPDNENSPPDISGMAATDESGGVQIFLCSHHDDWDVDVSTEVSVVLSGLDPNRTYAVQRSLVARGSSNAYTAWLAMGKPQSPSATQIAELRAAARLKTEKVGDFVATDGNGTLAMTLPAHSVCLLQLIPA